MLRSGAELLSTSHLRSGSSLPPWNPVCQELCRIRSYWSAASVPGPNETETHLSLIAARTHIALAGIPQCAHRDPLLAPVVKELQDSTLSLFHEDCYSILAAAISQMQVSSTKTTSSQTHDGLAFSVVHIQVSAGRGTSEIERQLPVVH